MAAQPARYHTTSHTDATLRVSRWAAYLHDQRVHTSQQLRDATSATRTAFAQRALASRDTDAEARRQRQLADALGREVFASLYEQAPQLDAPAAGTELVQQAHAMLSDLPEAQALAQQVQGDPDLCALATAQLLQGVAGALPAMAEQERQQAQQQAQEALGQRRRQRGPQADPDGALRRALRGAAQQAAQQARLANRQQSAAGMATGLGIGQQLGSGVVQYSMFQDQLKQDQQRYEGLDSWIKSFGMNQPTISSGRTPTSMAADIGFDWNNFDSLGFTPGFENYINPVTD